MEASNKPHFVYVSSLFLSRLNLSITSHIPFVQRPTAHGSDDTDKYFKTSSTQRESTCAANTHFVYGPKVAVYRDPPPPDASVKRAEELQAVSVGV